MHVPGLFAVAQEDEMTDATSPAPRVRDRARAFAPALLVQVAEFMRAQQDDPSTAPPYLELKLRGRVYMSGRLPPEATFKRNGDPLPNVIISDDVHGWPGRVPKRLK